MVLQTGFMKPEDWEHYLIKVGIPTDSSIILTATFAGEKVMGESLQMLDRSILKELEVTSMGEALCIHNQAEKVTSQKTSTRSPAAKLPQVNLEMTPQQFRKFQIGWKVFPKMTNMPRSQTNIHLYNCTYKDVPNAIVNMHCNFFTNDPDKPPEMVKAFITQRSNSIIHRLVRIIMILH